MERILSQCTRVISMYTCNILQLCMSVIASIKLKFKNVNYSYVRDFPGGSDGKASVYNVGDLVSIPGWGRFPGEGNGNPLQYFHLENTMVGGAWSMGLQRVGHN